MSIKIYHLMILVSKYQRVCLPSILLVIYFFLFRDCQQEHSLPINPFLFIVHARSSKIHLFPQKPVKNDPVELRWQIVFCGGFYGNALLRGDDCECGNERERMSYGINYKESAFLWWLLHIKKLCKFWRCNFGRSNINSFMKFHLN